MYECLKRTFRTYVLQDFFYEHTLKSDIFTRMFDKIFFTSVSKVAFFTLVRLSDIFHTEMGVKNVTFHTLVEKSFF
jgi:hypothetical protein